MRGHVPNWNHLVSLFGFEKNLSAKQEAAGSKPSQRNTQGLYLNKWAENAAFVKTSANSNCYTFYKKILLNKDDKL